MRALTVDERQLVEQHWPLVRWCWNQLRRRWFINALGEDDAVSAGALALVQAVDSYDPAKGPFLSFAAQAIRWRMTQAALRRLDRIKARGVMSTDEHEWFQVEDPYEDLSPEDAELVELMRRRMGRRQRQIMERWIRRETLGEIAASQGVTPSRIGGIIQDVIADTQQRFRHLFRP